MAATRRWFCLFGVVVALFLPDSSDKLRFIVPWLIGLIYTVSFLRIDLRVMIADAFRPQQIVWSIAVSLLLLVIIPLILISLSVFVGVDPRYILCRVVCRGTAHCLNGVDVWPAWPEYGCRHENRCCYKSAFSFTGPVLASMFLGAAVPVSSIEMLTDLAVMIFGGILVAQIWQRVTGQEWIDRNDTALSGLSAVAMLLFLVPVFNGVLERSLPCL